MSNFIQHYLKTFGTRLVIEYVAQFVQNEKRAKGFQVAAVVISSTPSVALFFAGCMICLGKSNYFRFNHPREAKRIKESHPGNRFSIVPDQYYPGMIDGLWLS